MSTTNYLASAQRTFHIEITALQALKNSLGAPFTEAVQRVLACRGRVVVTGIGKSGRIGRRIAAAFDSTGTPAFFFHAAEALTSGSGFLRREDFITAFCCCG